MRALPEIRDFESLMTHAHNPDSKHRQLSDIYNNNMSHTTNFLLSTTTELEITTELGVHTQQALDSLSQTRSLWATLPLQGYETEAYLCVLI